MSLIPISKKIFVHIYHFSTTHKTAIIVINVDIAVSIIATEVDSLLANAAKIFIEKTRIVLLVHPYDHKTPAFSFVVSSGAVEFDFFY